MALDLVNILSTTVAWLKTHNTATTGISRSLNKSVQEFYQGVEGMHTELPVPYERYPVIFVELANKVEEWERLGNSSKRETDINFNVVCITSNIIESNEGHSREEADMECIKLTQNVEGLLRTNIPLSNTVDYFKIDTTDYNATPGDSFYNCVSIINCRAKFYTD